MNDMESELVRHIEALVQAREHIEPRKVARYLNTTDVRGVGVRLKYLFNEGKMPGYTILHHHDMKHVMYHYDYDTSDRVQVKIGWGGLIKRFLGLG